MSFVVRDMSHGDVPACVAIVNHAIAQGGTTAHEEPFTEAHFADHYLDLPPVTNVVLTGDRVVGFQAAFDLGEGLYSIGSFTDRRHPVTGAGRALFTKTLADCRHRGGVAILAKITSDNAGGLAYCSRMGFADWMTEPAALTRSNGRLVDRIIKRFDL